MIALALLGLPLQPALEISYQEFAGLKVTSQGVPLITGSGWQFYEIGWRGGIYSSAWRPKTVTERPDGVITVAFEDLGGQLTGDLEIRPTASGFRKTSSFHWKGTREIRFEQALGRMWAPSVAAGRVGMNGAAVRHMPPPAAPSDPLEDRLLGSPGSSVRFEAPLGVIEAQVQGARLSVFDARSYSVEWAANQELVWAGVIDRRVMPGEKFQIVTDWRVTPRAFPGGGQELMSGNWRNAPEAKTSYRRPLPVIPQPKSQVLSGGVLTYPGAFAAELPEELADWSDRVTAMISRRHSAQFSPDAAPLRLRARIVTGIPDQGYRLQVTRLGVFLEASGVAGLRHGLATIPWLVQPQDGQLVMPLQEIYDYPALGWRGVHSFTGPTALKFQGQLIDRLLAPLKFNQVVVQCERTNFESIPGTETPITMDRGDLVKLFDKYRAAGIEPTPLIQSLGHSSWLFANGQNLDLAYNRDLPFQVDPRKPAVRELQTKLWREAVELLKPKAIHFGLDEIDMRGMPNQPSLTTEFWRTHVPFLLDLAKELEVEPMLWGDIMIGPGQAVDADHGDTLADAAARRAVLRPGVTVTDWHYKADPNARPFHASIDLFQRNGQNVIASTWFRPENIRGFTHAAIQRQSKGLLQTTWAGFESSEAGMIRNLEQFAAYVLAADYAWSGREEMPDKLPYDAMEVVRRLYFAGPEPVQPIAGKTLIGGQVRRIGPYSMPIGRAAQLQHRVSWGGELGANSVEIPVGHAASELVLALSVEGWLAEAVVAAEVELVYDDGSKERRPMRYGYEVRAERDPRPAAMADRAGALTAWTMMLESGKTLRTIRLLNPHPAAGVALRGAVTIP